MGLLNGSASVTRCKVTAQPEEIDFDAASFSEIPPSSSIREKSGFIPMEPGAEYRIGQHRWAFRVRIDQLKPDATAVRERLRELLKAERDTSGDYRVAPRRRRELRELAEEEILLRTAPKSRIIECCIDRDNLWIGNTSDAWLGTVLVLLDSVGVSAVLRTPWHDRGDEDPDSEIIQGHAEWQSILGCRFLKSLLNDHELMLEPVHGSVRLASPVARINLSGEVMSEVLHYIGIGAEMLAARIAGVEYNFSFDALNYRVNSLKIETEFHDAWENLLDERLEKIEALYDLLDLKYRQWMQAGK